jgi:LAO/AO transport system kinase
MEMADTIVINKSDGENLRKAKAAAQEYRNALSLYPKSVSGWEPPVVTCSALEKTGINQIWELILEYRDLTTQNHHFQSRRIEQSILRMHQSIQEGLAHDLYADQDMSALIRKYEQMIKDSKISGYVAANRVLETYKR